MADRLNATRLAKAAIRAAKVEDRLARDLITELLAETSVLTEASKAPDAPIVPTGAGAQWFTDTAPTGWLLLDGAAVSRTTYANLFALLGTTYGAGDGSTTFNLPDLRQRFPLGKAASGTGSTLGGTGGTIDHIHTADPPDTTSGPASAGTSTLPLVGTASGPDHTHQVNIPSFNTGTGNPPFLVVNYIIKT